MGIIVAVAVIAALSTPLAIVLIRFNRKRLHIIQQAATATEDQLERIYRAIESKPGESPTCAVLARTNRSAPVSTGIVPIPPYVHPCAGKSIIVTNSERARFSVTDTPATEPTLFGKVFRLLPVPRQTTKSGKSRNQFSPRGYVVSNPDLKEALTAVCPRYPVELLCYLLSAGLNSFEFDPIDQARVGGSPAWVQGAEFPNCGQCKKRMSLLLQLPGSLVPGKANSGASFYFFACARHPDETETVVQYD